GRDSDPRPPRARREPRRARSLLLDGSWPVLPRSMSPGPHHLFAMPDRISQERLGAFGALEPKVRIVVPGEADAAVDLDRMDRGLQIGLRRRGLSQGSEGRQVVI